MENKELTSEQKIKIELKKLDRYAYRIGIVGIIFLFGFTILATQFHIWFDFNNTGQIGDTIGGLTAPIIGIFSALLIYLSFRAQIKANYIVQGQIDQQRKEEAEKKEFNYQMEVYKHLKEVIEKFDCIDEASDHFSEFHGYEALNVLLRNLSYRHGNFFQLGSQYHSFIHSVLSQFDSIIESFQNPKNQNYDIRLPLQLVAFLFYDRFWREVKKSVLSRNDPSKKIFEDVLVIYNRINTIEQKLSSIFIAEAEKQQGHDILKS